MNSIVLMVEGQNDKEATYQLASRLLYSQSLYSPHSIRFDKNPIPVHNLGTLLKNNHAEWHRFLGIAIKRKASGVLLLLDGDTKSIHHESFCVVTFARRLAQSAKYHIGSRPLSVACVFACKEYESWLIAGLSSIEGHKLEGGLSIPHKLDIPPNVEEAPRDAKGWLRENLHYYVPTSHQAVLTQAIGLDGFRKANLRSFQRFEKAVDELAQATMRGTPVFTPT